MALASEIVGAISLAKGTLANDRDLARGGTYNGAALAVGWRIADAVRTQIGLTFLAGGFVLQLVAFGLQSITGDTDAPSWWAYLMALLIGIASPWVVRSLQRQRSQRRLRSVLGSPDRPTSLTAEWVALILEGAGWPVLPDEGNVAGVERVTGIRFPATHQDLVDRDTRAAAGG